MIKEIATEAFLSASFGFLLDKIASSPVADFLRREKYSSFDVLKLETMFYSLTAVLADAEQKQIRNPAVKRWMERLQDSVDDAEDLFDEIEYEALKLEVEAESRTRKRKASEFLSSTISNFFNSTDSAMKTKMDEILGRLEYFANQINVLGLEKGAVEEKSFQRTESTSLMDVPEFFGRNADKDALMNLLIMPNDMGSQNPCVIPIVGLGGVGKTTLAQAAFNDDEIGKLFELKVWACVSEDFDVCRITRTILEEITPSACNGIALNSLQVKLKEILAGKKFLLVLDDVWNENYVDWELMRMPFKDGAQGSKIIVTTRSEKVASIMGTVQNHHLKVLTDEASWELFAKHASGNGDFTGNSDLERIGWEIVKKCQGLPLAVKTLGGLLRFTRDVGEWRRVSKNDIWDFSLEESNILPALRLSYHYLPSQLKKCFAYCSIFPKDYQFDKEVLISLWMAENLLEHPKRSKRMEEVGDEYFNYLASRTFFQRSSSNRSLFVMHDLMVDLAIFVSKKCCFLLEGGNMDEISLKQLRHFAYDMSCHGDPSKMFNYVSEATCLRTFLPIKLNCLSIDFLRIKEIPVHDLMKLSYLRVLSLDGYQNIIQLPDSIGELRHLRYLDLSFTSISVLPESVSMLYNLQILKLVNCYSVTKLPKDFHRLIRLRVLDVRGCHLTEMPTQISKLKWLQILSIFIVGKENGTKITELGELSDLRGNLSIKNLQNVVQAMDALEAKLSDKYLEELELIWDGESDDSGNEREVLDHLLPNICLEKIKIGNYGGQKFPNWLGDQSFCNIVDVHLWNCKYCDSLPPFGQLSSLKKLSIVGFDAVTEVGQEFYGNSSLTVKPFASLESLTFCRMATWNNWLTPVEDVEAFPKLRKLTVQTCWSLIGDLPHFLPCLTELVISYCPQLTSSLPRMPVASKLELLDCENLVRIPGCHVVESFGSLQYLKISDHLGPIKFTCLPATLKSLDINRCEKFEFSLSRSYDSLVGLSLEYSCGSMDSFPMDSFPKIQYLHIEGCQSLESLSRSDGLCEGLVSLSSLSVKYCSNLIFPDGRLPCPSLTALEIKGCEKLFASWMNWNLERLANLTSLRIGECKVEDMESFPEKLLLPTTITDLEIYRLPCLKVLDTNRLQELTSLKSLSIIFCDNLQIMTEEGLPSSLRRIDISYCPLLEDKVQKEKGVYWNKISHVPMIHIDHRPVI